MRRSFPVSLLSIALVAAFAAAACSSSSPVTTAAAPTRPTTTSPTAATITDTAAPELDAPERVGPYRRIAFEGGAELAQSLVGEGVQASIFAVYGESADEESVAFMLVAAEAGGDAGQAADRLVESVVSTVTGKPVDATTLTEEERDGVRFRCGTAVAEGANFSSGFCVWVDGTLAAVALGVPPRGPSDGAAALAVSVEAARGLGDS